MEDTELDGLVQLVESFSFFKLSTVVSLAVTIALSLIVVWAIQHFFNWLWRHGLDRSHRYKNARILINVMVPAAFILIWFDQYSYRSLVAGLMVLILLTLALSGLLSLQFKNIYALMLILLKYRLNEGQTVKIDGHRGQIKEIGINHIKLEADSTRDIYVSPSAILKDGFEVCVGEFGYHLSLSIEIENKTLTPHILSEIKKVASANVYRHPRSPVRLHQSGTTLNIELTALSEELRESCEYSLKTLVAEVLSNQKPL